MILKIHPTRYTKTTAMVEWIAKNKLTNFAIVVATRKRKDSLLAMYPTLEEKQIIVLEET